MSTRAAHISELAGIDQELGRLHLLEGRRYQLTRSLEISADPRLHDALEVLRQQRSDIDRRILMIEAGLVASLTETEITALLVDTTRP